MHGPSQISNGNSRGPVGQGHDLVEQDFLQQKSDANLSPDSQHQQDRPLEPQSKRAAVLKIFLQRGKVGLNCFEAVRLAHDYVLRTSVSQLVRLHGVEFEKRWEQIPGHANSRVDCVRYWLSEKGEARALVELLGMV